MNFLLALFSLTGIWFLVVIIPESNFVAILQSSMSDSRISGLQIALGISTGTSVEKGDALWEKRANTPST